jgi:hypothetical protein
MTRTPTPALFAGAVHYKGAPVQAFMGVPVLMRDDSLVEKMESAMRATARLTAQAKQILDDPRGEFVPL